MSENPRANEFARREPDGEAADVAEAIKAMQKQLADLRKLVQAARIPGDTVDLKRRHG